MIKHIVMFKFLEFANGKTANENANLGKSMLEKLPSEITEIKEFEVGLNINPGEKGFDLVLNSSFQDMKALKRYKIHPKHIEVLDFFNEVRDITRYVDYEV